MKKIAVFFIILLASTVSFSQIEQELLQKAEEGDPIAQYNLALIHYKNKENHNYKKAFELFQKSAEQGYAPAQHNLGIMYGNGHGTAKNYKEAFNWYAEAAEQNYADAQCDLGTMYLNGYGVNRDYKKAFEWYEKAAKNGYPKAQNNLGVLYYNGYGVAKDYKTAAEWYEKAAKQGYASSQLSLGLMYLSGEVSGIKDAVTGCAWIYISKDLINANTCDQTLNQVQITRVIYVMDELRKEIK